MSDQAAFEESNARLVVWLGVKFNGARVFDEFSELGGVPATKFFEGNLNLLLLDGCVLLVLTAARKSLPRKRPLDQVE